MQGVSVMLSGVCFFPQGMGHFGVAYRALSYSTTNFNLVSLTLMQEYDDWPCACPKGG